MSDEIVNEENEYSVEELQAELADYESQYKNLKFDHAITGLANPMIIRDFRRNIARIKTELRAREIEEMSGEEHASRSKIRKRRRRQKKQR